MRMSVSGSDFNKVEGGIDNILKNGILRFSYMQVISSMKLYQTMKETFTRFLNLLWSGRMWFKIVCILSVTDHPLPIESTFNLETDRHMIRKPQGRWTAR
jgi:hypothetical protein